MSRAALVALALLACAAPAAAQTTGAIQPSPAAAGSGVDVLSRFDFQVSMEHLFSEEERFVWDANFGGDIDLVEFGAGRATFLANYQTVLGSEFRAFDPTQGNYTLEGSVALRAGALEAAGVFHHVSRHLSDRPKRFPIDWNMIGGRVQGGIVRGATDFRGRVDLRGVVQRTYVDYRWELDAGGRARVGLSPRVSLLVSAGMRVIGVDGSRDRGTQHGYRGEWAVRVDGRGAAVDLFVAAERRIDPYQLEFSTAAWLTTGFRFSSR